MNLTRWAGAFCVMCVLHIVLSYQVGGGGSFVVLPLEKTGRVGQAASKVVDQNT